VKSGKRIMWKLRTDRDYNRRNRELVAAAAGHTDEAPEQRPRPPRMSAPTARKQTGRRYGPPPAHDPHPRMQAPEPMPLSVRAEIYSDTSTAGQERFTPRQGRQFDRAAARAGFPEDRGPNTKGRATPKRRKASR
jgi:hypothetical protein